MGISVEPRKSHEVRGNRYEEENQHMRPFAGAFTQGGNLFTSLRLQQIRLRGLESNLGCIESHSFSASHPSCPQQWIVSRPLKAKTSCIKPGSSPEDVVKRVTKGKDLHSQKSGKAFVRGVSPRISRECNE